MSDPNAAAGWYPDTTADGRLRYWDGTAWTGHFAPASGDASGPGAEPVKPRRSRKRLLVVFGAGVLAVLLGVGGFLIVQNLQRQAQFAANCPVTAEQVAEVLGVGAATEVGFRESGSSSCIYDWGDEVWVRISWSPTTREEPSISDEQVPAAIVTLPGGIAAQLDAPGRAADPGWMATLYVRILWQTDRYWFVDVGRGVGYEDPAEAAGPAAALGAEAVAVAELVVEAESR